MRDSGNVITPIPPTQAQKHDAEKRAKRCAYMRRYFGDPELGAERRAKNRKKASSREILIEKQPDPFNSDGRPRISERTANAFAAAIGARLYG